MPDREQYPHGVPCWVDTSQPDPDAAVAFYGGLFGWAFENRMPADAPGKYLIAQIDGRDVAGIGSQMGGESGPPVWNTYVGVDSADEIVARVRDAGGSVLMEPFDIFDAGRMAVFADPSGAVFCVWQAMGMIGAQAVNDFNCWNFSELNTRDPEGAKAFYGAVFGWQTGSADAGDSFWLVEGYGDHLEQRDPGLRERLAEYQAPPRFEDAVAVLVPMQGRFPDEVPPHWNVTFHVEDADAIAAKAEELGGTVVVPPFDAPPVRVTAIRDPQGATFAAAKFDPTMGTG
jgi:predicted enzyme related to lactoylglutathione lyase